MKAILILLVSALGASALPEYDREWQNARCRYRTQHSSGPYGHYRATSLAGCIAHTQFILVYMANAVEYERPFHEETVLEFKDGQEQWHTCKLHSQKDPYDELPPLNLDTVVQPGYFDTVPPRLKQFLDENIAASCAPREEN